MKIVIDDKIPFIKGILEAYAEVIYLPGSEINSDSIKDVEALVIRTRTICNEQLLKNSNIKIIVTATIGYDHIDINYCKLRGIEWRNAPGCNSGSVMQYIAASLSHYSLEKDIKLQSQTIGIVGVGHVGKKIEKLCLSLGMNVMLCDPPREEIENKNNFVSIEKVQEEADIITFHTPLSYDGKWATYHLLNKNFIASCKKRPLIINTCRGEVIDTLALKYAIPDNIRGAIIDCWENEPNIDLDLLDKCILGTPHIAGYSQNGKANGTTASIRHLSKFFNWELESWEVKIENEIYCEVDELEKDKIEKDKNILRLILQTYNIKEDDMLMRENPNCFEKQRGEYPPRFEFKNYKIRGCKQINVAASALSLGFKVN